MKVLLADKLAPLVEKYLLGNDHQVSNQPSLKGDSLTEALVQHSPDVLVVRSTKIEQSHIDACPSLSLIVRAGAGVNTIDLTTASSKGIFVANCPGRNAIAVAELVMGHILNWDRHIAENIIDFRNGVWNKKSYSKSRGLLGQTIAICGMGAIGSAVVKRAQGFGLHIKAWSRSLTPEKASAMGVEYCASPIEAATGADILTVHLPAVADTKHFINAALLNAMNDGGFVINTSRNTLLDEAALDMAIKSKGLKAGLDVFDNEPASSDNTVTSLLCENPNVYVTHHIGASTEQATTSVAEAVVEIIDTWTTTGEVLNCVNLKQTQTASCCLSVRHADKVGILALILDSLKSEGHNIQEMENIIFQGGTAACARIFLVGIPSSTLVEELESNPDIFSCSVATI